MSNEFNSFSGLFAPSSPAKGGAAVTPNDSTNLTTFARSLYIGVSGNVSILGLDDSTYILTNVPVGILPVACKRVNSTNTTASGIVALY